MEEHARAGRVSRWRETPSVSGSAAPGGDAPTDLPIEAVMDKLAAALDVHSAAVLVAPPGTGKTTVVPTRLAAQPWSIDNRIVVVEPRRLAARAAARRMAEMAGEPVGRTVGYSVRGERRVGRSARVEVVTQGLFVRRIQEDPELHGIAAVLLDEFHERSIDTDLTLAFLLDARSALRPDLRLLVMSATIDPRPVAALLGGDDHAGVPVVTATAPLFDVETRYRPGSAHDPLEGRVTETVLEALRSDHGDVLVFLPGRGEIRRTRRALTRSLGEAADVELCELHSSLSPQEQSRVLQPSPRRRVILSTSLAETSITVPGVRVVVDSGRRRFEQVDSRSGLPSLRTTAVSRAGADQRRGRAGRTGPGVAYRLWSQGDDRHRPDSDPPEIIDGDLGALMLQLHAWGAARPDGLRWLDPPPPASVAAAEDLLVDLGALGSDRRLTATGKSMAAVGFHPRLAAIVVEGLRLGEGNLTADVLAVLETSRSGAIDLTERVRAARSAGAEVAQDLREARRLWRRTLSSVPALTREPPPGDRDDTPGQDDLIAHLMLQGYADRIARRRDRPRQDDRGRKLAIFHLRSGGEVALDLEHPLSRSRWLVVAELDAGPPGDPGRMHLGVPVSERMLDELIERCSTVEDQIEWDSTRGDVSALRVHRLGAIVLSGRPLDHPAAELVTAALCDGIRRSGLGVFRRLGDADQLRRRVAWLGVSRPADGWPDWSDDALLDHLGEWLGPHLSAARSVSDVEHLDLVEALLWSLDRDRRRSIDALAPTHWRTGTGRRVSLVYGALGGDPGSVVSSVPLRDLIGTDVHPTIGADRLPVTIEVLSPAGRPLQRTDDLPGFWRGSYGSVRAEMRGRYPKHPWPERPWEPPSPR